MKPRKASCPRCRKAVSYTAPFFPFCSQRCRLIDLGQWLHEEFRVPGEKAPVPEEGSFGEEPHE